MTSDHPAPDGTAMPGSGAWLLARDPDRFLAASYAGQGRREALHGLFALDIALGDVIASTREPMLGEMRLAWWRDALHALDAGAPPAEPVLTALARHVLPAGVPGAALAALEDGWLALLDEEPLTEAAIRSHGGMRGGALFGLAGQVLAPGEDGASARQLGELWALVDLAARVSDRRARDIALRLAGEALADGGPALPRALRPLGALAAIARRDLRRNLAGRRPGAPGRQLRMLAYMLGGW